jgi:translation initiation factor 4E
VSQGLINTILSWRGRFTISHLLDPVFLCSYSMFLIEWVLWEHAGGAKKDPNKWKENMKQLCAFSTIEDFWRYFNYIPKPSAVFYDGDSKKKVGPEGKIVEEYSLFKKGIEPEWGDPNNSIGGEWYCRATFDVDILDLYWQNLVLAVVGETIEDENSIQNHVNGARVVDKSKNNYAVYKLEVWLNTKDPDVKENIRSRLMEVIADAVPSSKKSHVKFEWKDHS